MDFRGLVWKWVRKIAFFGLKSGQDLENRAAHPHQEFPGISPPPGIQVPLKNLSCFVENMAWHSFTKKYIT